MNQELAKQLQDSLYVHFPMQADLTKTVESKMAQKAILHDTLLWDGEALARWRFDGEGEAAVLPEKTLALRTHAVSDRWPQTEVRAHSAQSGHYATFGSFVARLNVRGLDMSHGNRIHFKIRPVCDGLHSPIVRVGLVNNGAVKIPDQYSREGFNAMNLNNNRWNDCYWEMGTIAHDALEEVSFEIHRYGKEVSTGDTLYFELKDIHFEQIAQPETVLGWHPAKESAVFSTGGYFTDGGKTAIANTAETRFNIVDAATGAVAFSGDIQTVQNPRGTFQVLDFSALRTAGTYRIRFGGTQTEAFPISDTMVESGVWKLINFLYCERCGYPVPGKHGSCHGDMLGHHNGLAKPYAGGWHDAADVSQQTVQSAEILDAILEVAASVQDSDPVLHERLMEEANWGLDFVLRSRFGDGYRMAAGHIRRWTDNLIGNMDDCDAVVHNHSFENFIGAGVEAGSYLAFQSRDEALAWKCLDSAKADYAFAVERFEAVGLEEPDPSEHVACASPSQYFAAAAWAAARLFRATGEAQYQSSAEHYLGRMLACQETGEAGLPLKGFFYRAEDRRVIVHFSHQSRDHIFVQALEACCRNIPQSAHRAAWEAAMRLYGEYLKALEPYTAPYGMAPAGMFDIREADDRETFPYIHPRVDFDREQGNYRRQLRGGTEVAPGYFVKAFPVWFSYRGNSALHLSMGKAASLLGRYFGDRALTEFAREQLYWTLGKNPSGQSLIYGEGSHYGQQYTALLGETVGEIPVGIQTLACGDEPYWPQANIATYREVWTTPVGRWLWIAADMLGADR